MIGNEEIIKNIKVTVIIPIYNLEKYLKKCVESLLSQTLKEIEFIFIDDGSNDKSLELLKDLVKKDDRVKIISKNNSGVSASRNLAIDLANGEYIGFVDGDDTIDKDMFKKMYFSAKQENSEMVICNFKLIKNDKVEYNEYLKRYSCCNLKKFFVEDILLKLKNGYIWNKLYNKEIIQRNKIKFDENVSINEDTIFNLEYLKYVKKISYVDYTLYNYIQRKNSAICKIHGNGLYKMNRIYLAAVELAKFNEKNINILNGQIGYDYIETVYNEIKIMILQYKTINEIISFIEKCKKNKQIEIALNLLIDSCNLNFRIIFRLIKFKRYYILIKYIKFRMSFSIIKKSILNMLT